MSCKKSLTQAISIGHMIDHGLEPRFMFSTIEAYRTIPPLDDVTQDDIGIYSVAFNQDGTQVAAGGLNSTIRVINTAHASRNSHVTMKPSKYVLGMPITCMRYMPRLYDRLVACSPSGHIYMCYPNKEGFETLIVEDNETYAVDVSPDGMELVTCGRDRHIRVYRFANAGLCEESRLSQLIPRFLPAAVDEDMREQGHGMTIHAVRFHPENSCQIITAGWDNIVKMWDTRSKINPIWRVSGPHVCSPDGIDIKGNELFTGSWRAKNALQVWDLRQSTLASGLPPSTVPLHTIPLIGDGWNCEIGDTEYLYGVRVGDNHSVLASGSGFSGIRVVNRENYRPIGEVYAGSCVNSLDIVFGGRQVVAGCSNGNIMLCRMN